MTFTSAWGPLVNCTYRTYCRLGGLTIVPYFFLILAFQFSRTDSLLRQTAHLIEIHEGAQGVIVGTTGVASLLTSMIEADQRRLLAHISIGEEGRIILDRSFNVRPEFQISSKLGYTQKFSILLSGAVVKGQIIFSDKSLLVNVLFAGSLSLITILSILFFKWFQNNRIALAVARSQADLAKQIRHDIASPLSALNMIVSLLQNVPEPQRVILRKSVKRIHDIANQLSSVGKPVSDMVTQNERARVPSLATELLSPLIDEMVSEKRVQYREKQYVEIDVDLSRGYGLFSKINKWS